MSARIYSPRRTLLRLALYSLALCGLVVALEGERNLVGN